MSVRVVARIRPLLKQELEKDTIVEAATNASEPLATPSIVRIPNPKNEAEAFSFQFNSVYDQVATQQQVYDNEIAPTVKHLFKGFDVTIFAYGVTGTGKTHTMRGGKLLAERGVIPRLLSSIYRRSRKIEKDSEGDTKVDVAMSYYEIYNDRVFDLFEAPEKRTPAGLPIRDNNGKTVVVGLTERPCTSLKDFETLYDQANVNRSTSATKLNAHSSRSHAVLCVKVTQVTGNEVRVSTASAIDLAGSEDNRRTDNGKERMVESASINKSLFVLAQCVEAISKKQSRIPYRESKMTRILSLGQNNGLTVMILNLAPVRSYHLDTLSSLNFANRTKKIEVNEVENRPFFRTAPKPESKTGIPSIPLANRQPLRPKALSHNVVPSKEQAEKDKIEKPVKAFSVYSDKPKTATISRPGHLSGQGHPRTAEAQKRTSSEAVPTINRPSKVLKPTVPARPETMSQQSIEALIERKVAEKLAEQALASSTRLASANASAGTDISPDVQARLIALERRVIDQESARAEGLQYLLMAKQHTVRGEEVSALKMYQLALPYFPDNAKLAQKMLKLQEKITRKEESRRPKSSGGVPLVEEDEDYIPPAHDQDDEDEDASVFTKPSARTARPAIRRNLSVFRDTPSAPTPASHHNDSDSEDELAHSLMHAGPDQTPRSKHILRIINSRDVAQIRLLKGVGAKKAEMIVNALCEMDDEVRHVGELGRLKGVGSKGLERMREGLSGVVA